jgi:signal transduction histidine kinase
VSLKAKILSTTFLFMVLVFVLLTLNLLLDLTTRIRDENHRLAQILSVLLSDHLKTTGKDWSALGQRLRESTLVSDWTIVSSSRENREALQLQCASDPAFVLTEQERSRFLQVLTDLRTVHDGARVYLLLAPPSPGNELFVARVGMPAGQDVEKAIYGVVLIMVIGIALILLSTYILLNRFVLRPLNQLAEASSAVASGDFTKSVAAPAGSDEMARAIHAFNLMTERIQEYHRRMMEDIRRKGDELKETRHKLVAAQRLSSTGTLAAGIAHEINNPLSGLINMALALKDKSLDDRRKREYMEMVIEGLYKIKATVDKILLFMPRPTQVRDVGAREIAQKAGALVEHRLREKGAELLVRVPEELGPIRVDPSEIQQVLLNVLINAIDAVEPGAGRIAIEARPEDPMLRLSIRDNGCGMTEEELSRCFIPFHTNKPEGQGTGLGLSIARSIVEGFGGDMSIESVKGQGSCVHVLLPFARPGAPQEEAAPSGGQRKI